MKILKLLIIAFTVLSTVNLMASQKYNPHERKWETVPEHSEMKYDPNSGKWNYQPKDKVEYNLFQWEWELDSGQDN